MKKERIKHIILVCLIAVATFFGIYALKLYLARIEVASREILNKTETVYETRDNELNSSGFYVAEFKSDLEEFLEKKNLTSLTYEFEGEDFSLDISVSVDDEGEYNFEIEKIACPSLKINARMNMKDVVSIEYRTSTWSKSTVLKINEKYNSDYFAMTEGTYYFLGQDIESISYMDDHFYYMTYNPNYRALEEVDSCTNEVKSKIHKFNMKDYYYRYGKINFLPDYYQKLASKTYTVQNKCDELDEKNKTEEDE